MAFDLDDEELKTTKLIITQGSEKATNDKNEKNEKINQVISTLKNVVDNK